MKQIKTVSIRLDNAPTFDDRVNFYLQEGWILKNRKVIVPHAQGSNQYTHIMLYAELEREITNDAE